MLIDGEVFEILCKCIGQEMSESVRLADMPWHDSKALWFVGLSYRQSKAWY